MTIKALWRNLKRSAMQFSLIFVRQRQWFLTGSTRTSCGYQTPKQGVRSTNIFRHTRPENFKDVLSIVGSAVNFVRCQTLNHGLFRVFVTKFKLNTMFLTTRKCRCYPVFECLFVFGSCAKKTSSFWDMEVVTYRRAPWKWIHYVSGTSYLSDIFSHLSDLTHPSMERQWT